MESIKHTVVIVDDHTLLSQAISELVNNMQDFNVLYTCSNGQQLINKLREERVHPEIVLMDINMPIMNGIVATKYMTNHYPDIKVLALSVEDDNATILEMLRIGARGYLLKDIRKEVLEEALKELIANGLYHTNEVTQILVSALNAGDSDGGLKEREVQFIKLACTERTYKEIAQEMFVSPKTVEGYRDSIYEKIQIRNRIGLMLYAIKSGLFRP